MQASVEQEWRRLRRERLIEAARGVFAARGFEQASMDEIAAAAGAGKPTLYRYFESKELLFEAVFVGALDDLERRLAEAERRSGDPAEVLHHMLDAIVPMFREHVAPLRTMSESAVLADRSRRRILRGRSGEIEARFAGVLRAGREAGIFHHRDDRLAARLLYGMVWSGAAGTAWDDPTVVAAILGMLGCRTPEHAAASAARLRTANDDRGELGSAALQARGVLQ